MLFRSQKVADKAASEGKEPQQFVDEIAPLYAKAWERLGISNDDFIRTTEQRHKIGVAELLQRCYDAGDIELDVYRQTFGAKAADSCQRMIGAQITRILRRAGDLCARYDEQTLVAAVVGQTPADVAHLVDQIADNVRQLGLHNPRGQRGRFLTVRPTPVGCPPGTEDDADALVRRAVSEQPAVARVAPPEAPVSGRGSAAG